MASTKKRTPALALPKGWIREECIRQNGLSRGKSDIYYYSPSGKKMRSKPELVRYLGRDYDLTCFDYRSGKIITDKSKAARRSRMQESRMGKLDLDTSVPNRQTASIFKQPVLKKTSHPVNKVKTEQNRSGGRAPQQLFREKRFAGLNAVDAAEKIIQAMDLPKSIQPIGASSTCEEILQRIATQLHSGSSPVTGQTSSSVLKDPCIWLNAQQPICKSFIVTEDDIRKQESRVLAARKRLELALKQDEELQRRELMLLA